MKLRLFMLIALCAGFALALAASGAQAVITVPIPTDARPAPPPIPTLPAAGETPPPAEAIADPVTPEAACTGWYQQGNYGSRWPAASTWWEYQCTYETAQYYPHPCAGQYCEMVCYGYPIDCYWVSEQWTDHFYWDGSNAVLYGELYTYSVFDDGNNPDDTLPFLAVWWDGPTAQWYLIECRFLIECPPAPPSPNHPPSAAFTEECSASGCSFDGSASSDSDGTIVAYEWTFGDGAQARGVAVEHTYAQPGTYTVELTVTDDDGGWSTESKTLTIEPPNVAPTSAFTVSCSGLSCTLNGSGSSDSDGNIVAYAWVFGDGTSASGATVSHTYSQTASYTVTLTVTDDDGASSSSSKTVGLIGLTAAGYKVKGFQKVDLSWSGPSGSFDVYRNSAKIATVSGASYTDNLNMKGPGSYAYKVCAIATSICSNAVTVTF